MTLLETAKKHEDNRKRARSKFSKEELTALAVAWFNGSITYSQACYALFPEDSSNRSGKVYPIIAVTLKDAIAEGVVNPLKFKS